VNPFSVAFVLGALVLTLLPVLQKQFLKAPAPIAPLGVWRLTSIDTERPLGSQELGTRVVLFFFAPGPCDSLCFERQRVFGRGLEHTDDLNDAIHLVTITRLLGAETLKGVAHSRWHIVSGTDDEVSNVLESFHRAWATFAGTDAGTSLDEWLRLPAVVLVDQNGWVRGFWRDDAAGRGNAINAARLLAKYGSEP
jgi:hypothetical protein